MADISTVAQTYDNTGTQIAAANAAANNYKSPDGFTDLGTPVLGFFSLTVTPASGNLNTTPTATNSNYSKAIRALQNHCELYAVGSADSTALVFVANRNTINAGGRGASATYGGTDDTSAINDTPTFENLEEAVKDAIGGTPVIAELTLEGAALA